MISILEKIFKKQTTKVELSDIGIHTDMHSHLLPGIDDGAKDVAESMSLIEQMHELGYQKIVTTPHIMTDYYDNSRDTILAAYDRVEKSLSKSGLEVNVVPAAEYFLDDNFLALVRKKEILSIGKDHVLVELPFINKPPNLLDALFEVKMAGYQPVMAHAERYSFFNEQGAFEELEKLQENEINIQVNINSLSGFYGKFCKDCAEKLIKEDMVDFLGTDIHKQRHIDLLEEALTNQTLSKIQPGRLKNNLL